MYGIEEGTVLLKFCWGVSHNEFWSHSGVFLSIKASHLPKDDDDDDDDNDDDDYCGCHILIVQKHLNWVICVLLNFGDVAGTSLRKLTKHPEKRQKSCNNFSSCFLWWKESITLSPWPWLCSCTVFWRFSFPNHWNCSLYWIWCI